nr:DUF4158 domain-containing protein [Escherichia coli]
MPNTRREHAALIRQHYQYREFAWPWTFRLTRLLYTRSWISNERPGLLFDLATGWLMQHRIRQKRRRNHAFLSGIDDRALSTSGRRYRRSGR